MLLRLEDCVLLTRGPSGNEHMEATCLVMGCDVKHHFSAILL